MEVKLNLLEEKIYNYQLYYSKVEGKLKFLTRMEKWHIENSLPIPEKVILELTKMKVLKTNIYKEFCILIENTDKF